MSTFPAAVSVSKETMFSDHCACLVEFGEPFKLKAGPFKKFNFLIKHKDFLNTVTSVWSFGVVQGCKIFTLE